MRNIINSIIDVIVRGKLLVYMKWVIRYTLKGDWTLGTEMAYWDDELSNNRPEGWIEPMHDDVVPAVSLLKETFKGDIKVLELGPGPRSRLTEPYKKKLFDLVAIDPLADDFKKYLGGEDFLMCGYGETVVELFPPETFHMCYASNVLDHSKDPEQCFKNMIELTKNGGLIMVQGNVNEGERTHWTGLHKYNMWIEGDRLMCSTRQGEPVELTDKTTLERVDGRNVLLDGNPWFSVTYRKVR